MFSFSRFTKMRHLARLRREPAVGLLHLPLNSWTSVRKVERRLRLQKGRRRAEAWQPFGHRAGEIHSESGPISPSYARPGGMSLGAGTYGILTNSPLDGTTGTMAVSIGVLARSVALSVRGGERLARRLWNRVRFRINLFVTSPLGEQAQRGDRKPLDRETIRSGRHDRLLAAAPMVNPGRVHHGPVGQRGRDEGAYRRAQTASSG